ncbi:MAG: 23S rRNA (pseudouridine(1915)-N(3))-methyltransferase RlmH [Rhodobacteraceae bacterium]|nr:23S rRNA (pseudouridine(1915)-N(3))-methyltransferase RlmH [Paracoccaceae bacterium]
MKLSLITVGKLRKGPEADLIEGYLTRFDRIGRQMGLGPASIIEVEDKKGGGKPAEAALLAKALPENATLVVLDERGKLLTSPEFASKIAGWRDAGQANLAFMIGGADGLDASLLARADLKLSFGKMVWPHMLARVMLAEQLYRAASILSGAPYHRV